MFIFLLSKMDLLLRNPALICDCIQGHVTFQGCEDGRLNSEAMKPGQEHRDVGYSFGFVEYVDLLVTCFMLVSCLAYPSTM
jgi:hypothetical protein